MIFGILKKNAGNANLKRLYPFFRGIFIYASPKIFGATTILHIIGGTRSIAFRIWEVLRPQPQNRAGGGIFLSCLAVLVCDYALPDGNKIPCRSGLAWGNFMRTRWLYALFVRENPLQIPGAGERFSEGVFCGSFKRGMFRFGG